MMHADIPCTSKSLDDSNKDQPFVENAMFVTRKVVCFLLLLATSVTQGLVSRTGVDIAQHETIRHRHRRSIPLDLAMEQQLWQRREPPISALVWFRGNHAQVVRIVQQRAREIVYQNPWLLGTIHSNMFGRPVLEYEEIIDPTTIDTAFFFQHLSPEKSTVSRYTPVEKLYQAAKTSFPAVHERQGPLWQITIALCHEQPDQYFALGLSLSHTAGDGHVFIQLMSMICSDACDDDQSDNSKHKHRTPTMPIRELDMKPFPASDQIARQALGRDAFDFQNNSLAIMLKGIFGTIHRMLCIGKGEEDWFLVDEEAMDTMKKAAIAATLSSSSDIDHDNKKEKAIEAVSTNDVLASWFFENSGCTVGLLCVNYRGKLKGHSHRLGRNYWGALVYYQPSDFDSSTKTHRSIQTLQQMSNEVSLTAERTAFWDFVTKGSIAIATSWTRRKGHWSLPNCQEEVRLPLFDFASYCPTGFVVMRAFTPAAGRTAVYIAGDARMVNCLKDAPFRSTEPLV